MRAIVGRSRRCRDLEIAKWRSNSLICRGSESHAAWKGSSSILLRMLEIGEIDIVEKGMNGLLIGMPGILLLI